MTTLPTLAQLITDFITDLETIYGVNISDEAKVALNAFAQSDSGVTWLQYKQLGFVQKQIWPDTADSETIGGTLERFGRTRLRRNPFPARAGQYAVTVNGSVGAVIQAQTTFKSDDTSLNPGLLYILDAQYTLVTTADTIVLRALTPGLGAKLAIGNTLTSTSPIPLVNNPVTVSAEQVQPLAAETLEEYRTKTLNSLVLEAQGGAATDYRIWASDVQGVQQVYPYAKSGETNANIIYVESTIADSVDGKGTPSAQMLLDVEAVVNFDPDTTITDINQRGRRPNTVLEYYEGITPLNVDIVVLGSTFMPIQQALIISALTSAINLVRPYVSAADIPANKNDIVSANNINGIIFSQVPGANYTSVALSVDGTPTLSYTFGGGNIPYVNSITFA